jgi:ketosteroid isomerase-like protein
MYAGPGSFYDRSGFDAGDGGPFRNVVTMLHGVRDGLIRDANNYEQQEAVPSRS